MIYSGTKDGENYGFFLEKNGLQNITELSDSEHIALIDGQSGGKVIKWEAPDYKPKLCESDPPSAAEIAEQKKREITARLDDIDAKTTRPLRAILNNTGTEADKAKLKELERQAKTLRTELAAL